MMLDEDKMKAGSLIPMVTGSLSLIGSATIITMIMRSTKTLSTTYRRLLFGMSCVDIVYSLAYILSTLPSPSDSAHTAFYAFGNTATCTAQGLLLYTGTIGVPMYYCALCIYYYLTIAKEVKLPQMTSFYEPFFHGIPLVYILATGSTLLSTQSFNTSGTICYIASYPRFCDTDPSMDCIRGEHAAKFMLYFNGLPLIGIFFVIVFCMSLIILTARRREQALNRYNTMTQGEGRSSENIGLEGQEFRPDTQARSRFRVLFIQCSFYVSAYFFTWIFAISFRLNLLATGEVNYPLWILTQILSPMQGILNFVVYIRPQVINFMSADKELTVYQAFWTAVKSRDADREYSQLRRDWVTRENTSSHKRPSWILNLDEIDSEVQDIS